MCGFGPSQNGVATKWCFGDPYNCPLPGTNGMMYDNGYDYDGRSWCCLRGTGIVPGQCGTKIGVVLDKKLKEIINDFEMKR